MQLSSHNISNKGLSPRYPLLRFLVISWQIICTFHFRHGFWVSLFFFLLTEGRRRQSLALLFANSAFQLVSCDAIGVAQPLPAELGPLPLYPLGNGYYSVLGPSLGQTIPEDHDNGSPNDTPAYNHTGIDLAPTLTPSRDKVFCGSKCSGNRFAPLPLYTHPSHQLTSRSGLHTCSPRSYTCKAPSCTRPTPFKTQQALNRHYEVIHLAERIDCPFPGCENVGEKGIKRYDNLVIHMRNKHGVSPAGDASGE